MIAHYKEWVQSQSAGSNFHDHWIQFDIARLKNFPSLGVIWINYWHNTLKNKNKFKQYCIFLLKRPTKHKKLWFNLFLMVIVNKFVLKQHRVLSIFEAKAVLFCFLIWLTVHVHRFCPYRLVVACVKFHGEIIHSFSQKLCLLESSY